MRDPLTGQVKKPGILTDAEWEEILEAHRYPLPVYVFHRLKSSLHDFGVGWAIAVLCVLAQRVHGLESAVDPMEWVKVAAMVTAMLLFHGLLAIIDWRMKRRTGTGAGLTCV